MLVRAIVGMVLLGWPAQAQNTTIAPEEDARSLDGADLAVILIYFFVLLMIAFRDSWWPLWKRLTGTPHAQEDRSTAVQYFLAAREMRAYAVGASLFASNIGSEHFVGLAGSGAARGMAVGWFEWSAPFFLMLLAWVFVPLYLRSRVYTMPEYMQHRFGSQRLRTIVTIISLFLYVFTKISASLYAAGVIFKSILGVNPYVIAVTLIAITGTYTALGGLRAVVYTEVFNTVTLLGGGLVLFGVCMSRVGGWDGLQNNVNVPPSFFHMAKPPSVCSLMRSSRHSKILNHLFCLFFKISALFFLRYR